MKHELYLSTHIERGHKKALIHGVASMCLVFMLLISSYSSRGFVCSDTKSSFVLM